MIKVNGNLYKVVEARTPFAMRNSGLSNTAEAMEKSGIAQMLTVMKPTGQTLYQVVEYKSGAFGKVLRIA